MKNYMYLQACFNCMCVYHTIILTGQRNIYNSYTFNQNTEVLVVITYAEDAETTLLLSVHQIPFYKRVRLAIAEFTCCKTLYMF